MSRRGLWTTRQLLEARLHAENSFLTLTYGPDNLPPGGTLVPSDFKNFLKRFRRNIEPLKVRFYGVGEYGERTSRPHYHATLFGVGDWASERVSKAWRDPQTREPIGHVLVAPFSRLTAQYVAGYVMKKMTAKDDPRLNGRHPEFPRMSNRPGLAAGWADAYVKKNKDHPKFEIPSFIMIDGKRRPVGRYLRKRIMKETLNEEQIEAIKQAWIDQERLRLHGMFYKAQEVPEWFKKPITLQSLELEAHKTKLASLEYQYQVYESKGKKL